MDKIPIVKGLDIDLEDIAKKIQIYNKYSDKTRSFVEKDIRQKAEQIIPRDIGLKARKLVQDLCYDREFCKRTGLDYNNPNSSLITIVIAEYLIKKYEN